MDDYERFEDDYYDAARDEYEAGLINDAIREQSEDAVRWALGTYGDSATARIDRIRGEARSLTADGHFGYALLACTTAAEIMVRFLVFRPLVQGVFLSDEWAAVLADRVLRGRSDEDRRLLPSVVGGWGLDLDAPRLPDERSAWAHVVGPLRLARNAVAHEGALADMTQAQDAITAVDALMRDFVEPLAARFRLSWPATTWHEVRWEAGNVREYRTYEPLDAFG